MTDGFRQRSLVLRSHTELTDSRISQHNLRLYDCLCSSSTRFWHPHFECLAHFTCTKLHLRASLQHLLLYRASARASTVERPAVLLTMGSTVAGNHSFSLHFHCYCGSVISVNLFPKGLDSSRQSRTFRKLQNV